jgi:hypothetical protein
MRMGFEKNTKLSKCTPERSSLIRRTSLERPELEISHRYGEGTSSSISHHLSRRSSRLSRRNSNNYNYGESQAPKEMKASVRPGNTSLRPNQAS